ncbi:DUF3265 domain-containing protein [Vibrio parahaemolyticus]|nr:DUF3265 domain-containing protein [Vibrio parahaemolyticus]TBT70757.1 DUF3265 domain-containing protein [Vibrio parahaemolyticus]
MTSNLRGIHNAWHFCFYFSLSVYGTMLRSGEALFTP